MQFLLEARVLLKGKRWGKTPELNTFGFLSAASLSRSPEVPM